MSRLVSLTRSARASSFVAIRMSNSSSASSTETASRWRTVASTVATFRSSCRPRIVVAFVAIP
ncbi:hypothetical protein [Frankia sp. CiP1_Cm_nod1]|uniref:hypothetical protein n=1 Tax=Frankia sp. CiP1_Cm_nod1 TaxID=2897160 RepID=UPI0020243471